MHKRVYVAAIAFAALFSSVRSEGAIAAKADDFVQGPAQWLMTPDEVRAIRSATTDEAARKAIDLFWVRRDPTPGTPRNEFRDEFESRVALADRDFRFHSKRGSLTDLGKVYILLGPPKKYANFSAQSSLEDSSAMNHGVGGRFEWSYPLGTNIGLSGRVVFIEIIGTGEYKYDLQHGNIGGALALARQRALVSAGLTEVPPWAVPKAVQMTVPSPGPAAHPTPSPAPALSPAAPASPASAPPQRAASAAGVRALVLTKDVMAIDPRGAGDALAKTAVAASFTTHDELGYAFQYCGGWGDAATRPPLGLTLTISGESEGKKVHFSAAEDDLVPDGIPALPGCYLVRGSLPLADVGRGVYELALTLTDKALKQTYDLKQRFKVE